MQQIPPCSTTAQAPKHFLSSVLLLLASGVPHQVGILFAAVLEQLWPSFEVGNPHVQDTTRTQAMFMQFLRIPQDPAFIRAVTVVLITLCSVGSLPHGFPQTNASVYDVHDLMNV